MKKVKVTSKNVNTKRGKSLKAVPFVMTYHLKLKSMNKVTLKYLDLLYMDKEFKRVFTPKPMISFRSARKLSSYLVRAKLYPTERTVGSYNCGGKRYEVCYYLLLTLLLYVVIFIIVIIIIIIIVFMVVITVFIFIYFCFYHCYLFSSNYYCLYCFLSLHYCYCLLLLLSLFILFLSQFTLSSL